MKKLLILFVLIGMIGMVSALEEGQIITQEQLDDFDFSTVSLSILEPVKISAGCTQYVCYVEMNSFILKKNESEYVIQKKRDLVGVPYVLVKRYYKEHGMEETLGWLNIQIINAVKNMLRNRLELYESWQTSAFNVNEEEIIFSVE